MDFVAFTLFNGYGVTIKNLVGCLAIFLIIQLLSLFLGWVKYDGDGNILDWFKTGNKILFMLVTCIILPVLLFVFLIWLVMYCFNLL